MKRCICHHWIPPTECYVLGAGCPHPHAIPGRHLARAARALHGCCRAAAFAATAAAPKPWSLAASGSSPQGHFYIGKNEVASATSKMAKYIEVLHGSVKEGGGVKCIKRGEIPYCTFTYTYCFVDAKSKAKRLRYTGFHPSAAFTHTGNFRT